MKQKTWLVWVACLFMTGTGWLQLQRVSQKSVSEVPKSFLSLEISNGAFALGQEELWADFLLVQGMVYYGQEYRKHRNDPNYSPQGLVDLFEAITNLDPWYYEAYRLAGNLLRDPEDRIRMYEKASLQFPKDWRFIESIGFLYFNELQDPLTAAKYYEQASQIPERPPYVASLASRFYQKAGYYESAIRTLRDFALQTENEQVREILLSRARRLEILLTLQISLERFKRRFGRLPQELSELVQAQLLPSLPSLPGGGHYRIDHETGRVIEVQDN